MSVVWGREAVGGWEWEARPSHTPLAYRHALLRRRALLLRHAVFLSLAAHAQLRPPRAQTADGSNGNKEQTTVTGMLASQFLMNMYIQLQDLYNPSIMSLLLIDQPNNMFLAIVTTLVITLIDMKHELLV
uniref:Uncharacterized protein n=1 Tax=Oryza meridionalis TaxID=40149 RepID=A0A0E0DKP5_9ORYZ